MWLFLAFLSAGLLGFYEVAKKKALINNAVLPVLLLNTFFSTLIFSPLIFSSVFGTGWFSGTVLDIPQATLGAHLLALAKAAIVLASWVCGFFGLKHLPITIVGPINATRPVLVLIGAMVLFGERLNACQWTGVILSLVSLFLLSRAGKREGVNFARNKWIGLIVLSALLATASGLYDKFIMARLEPLFVQSWYNFYQLIMMSGLCALIWWPQRKKSTPFHWSWAIPLISVFMSLAEFAYFTALTDDAGMISIVSMIRRGSVIVSFVCGALLFHEKNLRAKALDLVFILVGMVFLGIGSRA